jgi:CheY-like chemotaxis protein
MVEDDENTRELYRYQFEDWDLPVDCTFMPSALEAMMDIASMRPDLLITDLSMPGVDGIEMLKACKRNLQLLTCRSWSSAAWRPKPSRRAAASRPKPTCCKSPSTLTGCMAMSRRW